MSDQGRGAGLHGDVFFEGNSTGVLMLHGLGGTPAEVRFIAQGLSRQGFTVSCPLISGHGGSDLFLSTTTWREWLQSAEAAYERLRARCDTVIIAGQSAGAMLAIHIAAKHADEVAGLVLYSPTFWPNGWAIPRHLWLFKLVRQRWFANLFNFRERAPYGLKDERIRRFVLESLQQDGRPLADIFGRRGSTVFEFRQLAKSARRHLKLLRMPSLVFHSREDDQANLSNAWWALRDMGGRVDLVVLDDSYHLVTLDRQRTLVMDRTAAFAAEIAAKADAAAGASGAGTGRVLREVAAD